MSNKRILIALIPAKAALGALLLFLSVEAPPPLFGLYLSLAAWLFVLSFVVLPYVVFKTARDARLPSEAYTSIGLEPEEPTRPRRRIAMGPFGNL